LIKHNVDINQHGSNLLGRGFHGVSYCTPIVFACRYGHTDIVKLLLDNNCDVLDNDGFSDALHYACVGGFVDIVDLLLRNNCNINQRNKLMKTPLILAVEGQRTKVVTMLVKNKCDIDISDKDGRTALDIAEENQVVDIKNILLNVMKKDTYAHDGC
jgi:ankyrin repeat protein